MRCGCEHDFFQRPGSRLRRPDSPSRASVAARSHRQTARRQPPWPWGCSLLAHWAEVAALESGDGIHCEGRDSSSPRYEGCWASRYFWQAAHV
jgi:hypothetical protein